MVSARATNPALAEDLALDLASVEASAVRAQVGRQVVVTREAWGRVTALANDPLLAVFRQAALGARPMPARRAVLRATFARCARDTLLVPPLALRATRVRRAVDEEDWSRLVRQGVALLVDS